MPLDALRGEAPERYCAGDCDARDKTRSADAAAATDEMPLQSAASLCETALRVLTRDSHLRRAYVQRRWQGLVARKSGR